MGIVTIERTLKALLLGLGIAAACVALALSPIGYRLEGANGLPWLFRLRGAMATPDHVLVVSMDRASGARLGLSPQLRVWPRVLHARLIDELVRRGAAVICFDVLFREAMDPDEDAALARSVAAAGRVVLVEAIDRSQVTLSDDTDQAVGTARVEQRIRPLEAIARGARAIAAFPLPRDQSEVSQFWAFRHRDEATLPAVVLQLFALAADPGWQDGLRSANPGFWSSLAQGAVETRGPDGLPAQMTAIRDAMAPPGGSADLAGAVAPSGGLPAALLALYAGPDGRYLNFYGPPGTIRTVPFADILDGRGPSDLHDTVVFVGASELTPSTNLDGFPTVFSTTEGVDLKGVEIAATAFANLATQTAIVPTGRLASLLTMFSFGLVLGLAAYRAPALLAVPLVLLAGTAYIALALWAFRTHCLWFPLAWPILVQLPLTMFAGLAWQYRGTLRERHNLDRSLRAYLPVEVAAKIARSGTDREMVNQNAYGVCLVSDVARFTTLAETLAPADVRALLNSYFELVFEIVARHGGAVSNVVGDGLMCVWTGHPDDTMHRQAALAALEILAVVDRFNRDHVGRELVTRIGLHAGSVMLGNLGGAGHFSYGIIGDVPNTASRIEGLNKLLQTRVLCSAPVSHNQDAVLCRPVGRYRLAGKSEATAICELVEAGDRAGVAQRQFCRRFAEAMAILEAGEWSAAAASLEAFLRDYPQDGPAAYHLARCRDLAAHPLSGRGALVILDTK